MVEGSGLTVRVSPGLAPAYVEGRKKRDEERRRAAEQKAAREAELRRAEASTRAIEREKLRKIRIKEKKERKAMVKARKKQSLDKRSPSVLNAGEISRSFSTMSLLPNERNKSITVERIIGEKKSLPSVPVFVPFGAPRPMKKT